MNIVCQAILLVLFEIVPTLIEGKEAWLSKPVVIVQNLKEQNQVRQLKLSLPESITVWWKDENKPSETGKFINFTQKDLTVSAQGISETYSLLKVRMVEFSGDVWIENSRGEKVPWRNTSRTFEKTLRSIPIKAFKVHNIQSSGLIATLNLGAVSQVGLDSSNLSGPNERYILERIIFKSLDNMTIEFTVVVLEE